MCVFLPATVECFGDVPQANRGVKLSSTVLNESDLWKAIVVDNKC